MFAFCRSPPIMHSVYSSCLLHHRDPFDRQIIAQAFSEDLPVVTSDEKFSLYKGLRLIW